MTDRELGVPFDATAVKKVADLFGAASSLAPLQLPGGTVYQIMVPDSTGKPVAMLTLWPKIGRVDVVNQTATVVFSRVSSVDLIGGLEVVFRKSTGERLIVALTGKLMVRG